MPQLLVINPKRKKKTTRKKRKLSEWNKAVKKYGGIKEAKKHYSKKTGKMLKRAKSKRKRKVKKNVWTNDTTGHSKAAKKGWKKRRKSTVKKRKTKRRKSRAKKNAWFGQKKKHSTAAKKGHRTKKRKSAKRSSSAKKAWRKRKKTTVRNPRKKRSYKKKSKRSYKRRNKFSLNPDFRLRKVRPHAIRAGYVIGGLLGARILSNIFAPWLARFIPQEKVRSIATDLGVLAVVGAPLAFPKMNVPFMNRVAKEGLFVGALANFGIKLIANYAPAGMKAFINPVIPEYAVLPPKPPETSETAETGSYITPYGYAGLGTHINVPDTFYGRPEELTTPLGVDVVPFGNKTFEASLRDMGDD